MGPRHERFFIRDMKGFRFLACNRMWLECVSRSPFTNQNGIIQSYPKITFCKENVSKKSNIFFFFWASDFQQSLGIVLPVCLKMMKRSNFMDVLIMLHFYSQLEFWLLVLQPMIFFLHVTWFV